MFQKEGPARQPGSSLRAAGLLEATLLRSTLRPAKAGPWLVLLGQPAAVQQEQFNNITLWGKKYEQITQKSMQLIKVSVPYMS